MIMRIVMALCVAISRRRSHTLSLEDESNPDKGSSNSKSLGLLNNAAAIANILRWPPLSLPTRLSVKGSRTTFSSTPWPPSANFSVLTVKNGRTSCNTSSMSFLEVS
mmetsp:Transcript_31549/g.63685  ORF Transcript_31549/g.63685 Transcript_31549/m.63685 type:complete len:107 (+) Transcript_31549:1459-1779(+)